jgi:hypothetical protein
MILGAAGVVGPPPPISQFPVVSVDESPLLQRIDTTPRMTRRCPALGPW